MIPEGFEDETLSEVPHESVHSPVGVGFGVVSPDGEQGVDVDAKRTAYTGGEDDARKDDCHQSDAEDHSLIHSASVEVKPTSNAHDYSSYLTADSMQSKLKVIHLFSSSGAACDHSLPADFTTRAEVEAYSITSEAVHELLDPSGWESLLQRLSPHRYDLLVLTPPCLTFYSNSVDGVCYRGSASPERLGLKGLNGEAKSRLRIENLGLQRLVTAF